MKKKNKSWEEVKAFIHALLWTGVLATLFYLDDTRPVELYLFVSILYGLYANFRIKMILK